MFFMDFNEVDYVTEMEFLFKGKALSLGPVGESIVLIHQG